MKFKKGHTPWHKGNATYIECKRCKKEVRSFPSRPRVYCSHSCAMTGKKQRIGLKPTNAVKKGQRLSPKTEFKKGHKPINYIDGRYATRDRRQRSSKEWKQWRQDVFERDDYTCQTCGKRRCTLHPHHIHSRKQFPELIYDVWNGVTLYVPCHMRKTMGGD